MTREEHIANVRSYFTDSLSLRIFDKRVEMGTAIRSKVFPETLELTSGMSEQKSSLRKKFRNSAIRSGKPGSTGRAEAAAPCSMPAPGRPWASRGSPASSTTM